MCSCDWFCCLREYVLCLDDIVPLLPTLHLAPFHIRQVSMPVLNGVREVKSSMNKLLTRVQRLKQELEDILDDDDDMAVRQSGL